MLIGCGFTGIINAQQRAADSLERIINTLPEDTAKVNRLNALVPKLQYLDPGKAALKVEQSIRLSEKINYSLGLATAYRLRGVLYIDRSVLDSGIYFYDKAYAIVKGKDGRLFRRQAGLLTHNYGVIFHHKQQYDSATTYYLRAATMLKAAEEESLCFFPYANLSTIYGYLKDYDKALLYAKKTAVAAEKMNDVSKIVLAVNQEVTVRILMKQYDSVYVPLRENIKRANAVQNLYAAGKSYNLLGGYYHEGKHMYDSCIYYRKKALANMEKLNNQYEIVAYYKILVLLTRKKAIIRMRYFT